MYKIIYESEAGNDLEEIVFYYAEQAGLKLAEDINNLVFAKNLQHGLSI